MHSPHQLHRAPGGNSGSLCPRWSGPPARSRELGRAGQGWATAARLGARFSPRHLLRGLTIAWWPVLRRSRGRGLPAASRRWGSYVASPATVGTWQAGWETAATCSGGWALLATLRMPHLSVKRAPSRTGPPAASWSPRTIAGLGPARSPGLYCGRTQDAGTAGTAPATRTLLRGHPGADEDSGDCWPAARAGRSVPSSNALSWCPGEDSEGALGQPREVTGQEGF